MSPVFLLGGGSSSSGARLPVVTGGTLTSDATYYYRTFLSSGDLVVTEAPLVGAEALIIGGGGGGGTSGAGAGTVLFTSATINANTYPVVVGPGGNPSSRLPVVETAGTAGTASSFNGSTAPGGAQGRVYFTGFYFEEPETPVGVLVAVALAVQIFRRVAAPA